MAKEDFWNKYGSPVEPEPIKKRVKGMAVEYWDGFSWIEGYTLYSNPREKINGLWVWVLQHKDGSKLRWPAIRVRKAKSVK